MKTIKDLYEALLAGKRPVVTFTTGIEDKEDYAEGGMRARVLSATTPHADGVLQITFDFEEFAQHNVAFEKSTYYDKQSNPVLTAREAGFYRPQDHMYFDLSEELGNLMVFEDDAAVKLFQSYKAENSGVSYVSWLERKVLATGQ